MQIFRALVSGIRVLVLVLVKKRKRFRLMIKLDFIRKTKLIILKYICQSFKTSKKLKTLES